MHNEITLAHLMGQIHSELYDVRRGIHELKGIALKGFEEMASKATEMNAALDELAALVLTEMAEIEKQLAAISDLGTSEADMDAAISRVRAIAANVAAGVERLKSDNPPDPVPTP